MAAATPPLDEGSARSQEPSAVGALEPFLRAIRSHRLIVALIVLATVAGGIAQLVRRDVEYQATAQILVTPVPDTDRSLVSLPLPRTVGPPARALETAAEIAQSSEVAEEAADRVEATTEGAGGNTSVVVEVQEESDVLDVTATARSPELAASSANVYVSTLLEARREELAPLVGAARRAVRRDLSTLADPNGDVADELRARLGGLRAISDGTDPTLSLVQSASPPAGSTASPAALIIGLAIAAGIAIGSVVALLIELLVPGRIKDEVDLLEVYPLPVLARLPILEHYPVRSDPSFSRSSLLRSQFRNLRTRLELRGATVERRDNSHRAPGGRVVVITSATRGEGRTTVAIGLAQAIASAEQSVVLFDLDVRAPAVAERLGIRPAPSIPDLPEDEVDLNYLVKSAPGTTHLGVFATRPPPDEDIERTLAVGMGLVSEAREWADWVIIDAAPLGEVGDALAVAASGAQIVIVSRIDSTETSGLGALRGLLDDLGSRPAGHILIGVQSAEEEPAASLPAVPYLGPGRAATSRSSSST